MAWSKMCAESFKRLLRFGRKNCGEWDEGCDAHDHCFIPDDDDANSLLADARLGEVVREYFEETGSWPGDNELLWKKFEDVARR